MAKDQSNFFKTKNPWSEVKDDLLACYLKPYFQKVLFTHKPVRYVDCFAGRGTFDDGKLGSPLIALNMARQCLAQTRSTNLDLAMTFIEPRWSAQLDGAAAAHEASKRPRVNYSVRPGRFEHETLPLLETMAGHNVFLYIDPYGIKNLDHQLIARFGDANLGLASVELLINVNSFGFLRAGCRVMKVRYGDDAALRDDEEFAEEWDPSDRSFESLNAIAGGDYWQGVVRDFERHDINGFEAEKQFSSLYRAKLGETYRYVLSMPIRLRDRQQPKYRMVHATNHAEGCILMADNMVTRTDNLVIYMPSYQQGSLFDESVDGEITSPSHVQRTLRAITDRLTAFTPIEDVIADFYAREGVVSKSGVIRRALGQMEKDGILAVERHPPRNSAGTPATFLTSTKKKKVLIRPTGNDLHRP